MFDPGPTEYEQDLSGSSILAKSFDFGGICSTSRATLNLTIHPLTPRRCKETNSCMFDGLVGEDVLQQELTADSRVPVPIPTISREPLPTHIYIYNIYI